MTNKHLTIVTAIHGLLIVALFVLVNSIRPRPARQYYMEINTVHGSLDLNHLNTNYNYWVRVQKIENKSADCYEISSNATITVKDCLTNNSGK